MVTPARAEALKKVGKEIPKLQRIIALLDTGASCSAIDQSVLDALELTPTGEVEILTPSTGKTPQKTSAYDVVIGIFAGREGDLHYVSDALQITASDLYEGQRIHALIGRDVLSKCIFQYNGADGQFMLAY